MLNIEKADHIADTSKKVKTNGDRIREMSNEELALVFQRISDCCCAFGRSQEHFDEKGAKESCADCPIGYTGQGGCYEEDILEWLEGVDDDENKI